MERQPAFANDIRLKLGKSWIPSIYSDKVRTQRSRAFHLDVPAKENRPEILHTLLGIELKVRNRRFACPDLATARYLRVFGRIGCRDFAVPYDITKISTIADELETAWQQMVLLVETSNDVNASQKGRLRSTLVRKLREDLAEIGAGDTMPAFDRPTRQRTK